MRSGEEIRGNLEKTLELINTVFALKLAWIRTRHPDWNEDQLQDAIYQGILSRKERQWTSPPESSTP